jgi:hypothetical protein
MNQSKKLTIASIVVIASLSFLLFQAFRISVMLNSVLEIEIGQFVGPILGLILSMSILILAMILVVFIPAKIEHGY